MAGGYWAEKLADTGGHPAWYSLLHTFDRSFLSKQRNGPMEHHCPDVCQLARQFVKTTQ